MNQKLYSRFFVTIGVASVALGIAVYFAPGSGQGPSQLEQANVMADSRSYSPAETFTGEVQRRGGGALTSPPIPLSALKQPVGNAPFGATADWKKVVASMSLTSILDAMEKSGRADDRIGAIRLRATCFSISDLPDDQFSNLVRLSYSSRGDPLTSSIVVDSAVSNALTARKKMNAFCEPIVSPEVTASTERMRKRGAESSVTYTAFSAGKMRFTEWTQEQVQAATLALSNPGEYPLAVAYLLESRLKLPSGVSTDKLTVMDNIKVRSFAYQELTGDRNPESIQNLFICMNYFACDISSGSGAGTADNQRLMAVAEAWVHAVRTQQWKSLGL